MEIFEKSFISLFFMILAAWALGILIYLFGYQLVTREELKVRLDIATWGVLGSILGLIAFPGIFADLGFNPPFGLLAGLMAIILSSSFGLPLLFRRFIKKEDRSDGQNPPEGKAKNQKRKTDSKENS